MVDRRLLRLKQLPLALARFLRPMANVRNTCTVLDATD
jgi:hypothetical protein